MNAAQLVLVGCGVLTAGAAVAALLSPRRNLVGPFAFLVTLAAGLLIFPAALGVLLTRETAALGPLLALPSLGPVFTFQVDPLSAFFLLITSATSTLAALYSVSYMRIHRDQHLLRYYPLLLLFFAAISAVVSAADWFAFLVLWEFMTVCSYFLVIFEKEVPAVQRAGLKYLVMTHAATALMLMAVIITWRYGHSFDFATARDTMASLLASRPGVVHVLLALWFVAFATKAGLLPFGDWLPDAYAAAPTSASAAFGGTMTKLAVYGLLRVFIDMLPASEASVTWGAIIAVFGAASIFLGTLQALAQSDAKRLMSWHVIGQMGYIVLAVGTGLFLLPTRPMVGLVAIVAGMFHLVNNVLYKSVLFMSAGSAQFRTGERDLNRLGGLWSFMPLTGLAAFVASLSIAGVPPLNGFASKWLIYNVTVLGVPGMAMFAVLGVVAAFISLVTLASFLKFLGGAFLGQTPASAEQIRAGDVPAAMQIPQLLLAGLCVLFGVVPMIPLTGIYYAAASLGSARTIVSPEVLGGSWLGIRLAFMPGTATAVWLPIVGLASLVILGVLAQGLSRLGAAERRKVEIWHCGTLPVGDQGRYPAHSYYEAFKRAFKNVYPPVRVPRAGYPARFMSIFDFDRWLFQPMLRAGQRITEVTSHTHSGIPQLYLSWQVVGLILVVAALVLMAR